MQHNIPNFCAVDEPLALYRGGQPSGEDWAFLKGLRVTQVIKLNTDEEGSDEGALEEGLQLFKVPITVLQQIAVGPDNQCLQDAVGFVGANTFVHCGSTARSNSAQAAATNTQGGQDRTGLVIALYRLWVLKWPKQNAEAEMIQHGFHRELFGLWRAWEGAH